MMASGVWSTKSSTPLEACWDVQDDEGVRVEDALKEIGYLGDTPCDYRKNGVECHFELHIEQGPLLEEESKTVGIVTSVQGMKWFSIRVEGVEGHSGTTPMPARADALVTASRLITAVRDSARDTDLGVATVGVINSDTSSQATIPAGINFIIDIRCSTDEMVEQLAAYIFAAFDRIVSDEFHPHCIEAVRTAAVCQVGKNQVLEMKSKAGHDSAWSSRVCPTSMIFVPSRDGVSHNPHEYTSPEHCALGAQVLLDAVLHYDEKVKNGEF
jgi:hydantoinase/carbamoylase family amidase